MMKAQTILKILIIVTAWRLRWREKDKYNKSVRKSKNFFPLETAVENLYELIDKGIKFNLKE